MKSSWRYLQSRLIMSVTASVTHVVLLSDHAAIAEPLQLRSVLFSSSETHTHLRFAFVFVAEAERRVAIYEQPAGAQFNPIYQWSTSSCV